MDLTLFGDKLLLEATVFQKTVDNLLLRRTLAPSTGFGIQIFNGGEMRVRGVELALNATPVRTDAFQWISRTTRFHDRSKITQLPVPAFETGGFGTSLGAFRIEEGESATQIVANAGLDGDGNIIVAKVGDSNPDVRVGFSNDFQLGGLTLSTLVDWSQGNSVINLTQFLADAGANSFDYVPNPQPFTFADGSTATLGDGERRINRRGSLRDSRGYIEDGSYVKVREVALSYSLPSQALSSLFRGGVNQARLTLSGRNLLTFTDYSGLDPEVSNFGNQPIARNIDVAPFPPPAEPELLVLRRPHLLSHQARTRGDCTMNANRLCALLLMGSAALVGCDSDFMVPDLNNPGLESIEGNPSRAAVIDATQGLLIGGRAGMAGQTGYVAHLGVLGRESYTFDNSDPGYWDEMVAGALDPGNGAFGGSGSAPRYANIRNANIILNALDVVSGFTAEELESIRGFVKTFQALDLMIIVNMRDVNGAIIDVNRPIGEELAPFVTRDAALTEVVRLLDEAQTHLLAGGASFPFRLSSGFAGFDTPAAFLEVNRGLKARTQVYQGDYPGAVTSLGASFVSETGDMNNGVYHSFGTGSGDVANGLFQGSDPQIIAHPSIVADAEAGDQRVAAKTSMLAEAVTNRGLTTDVRFEIYPTQSSPLAILRNEELLLLRAAARWFSGDPGGAMDDLNAVRAASGGLGGLGTPGSDDAFVDLLLNKRRYSLLMEGHRWLDDRRFDRLADLPIDRAGDVVPMAFPVPRAECVARSLPVPCSA